MVTVLRFEYGHVSWMLLRHGHPTGPLAPLVLPAVLLIGRPVGILLGGLWAASDKERVCSETSREAEPEVIVAEGRIDLAAQRNAAHGVRMTPCAAARGASHAVVGTRGIPLR